MDSTTHLQTLENSLNPRDPQTVALKNLKAVNNRLIDAIAEAHESLLKSAGSSSEPDKILSACSILAQALAEVAKV
ncbi:MAG: hypothetical protein KME54_17690 [Tolypothrix brevis GSE-NOS-MK-07-07A]|jgi:hypothetical protein|nr:hypothetical protein [Tolypothrix brevis GSE-NOS-MK-07-07A]